VTNTFTEITANWKGDMSFLGTNETGGVVQMGTLEGKPGIGPMQLLLVGLAGCTGVDIISILQKKRIQISDMQVKVRARRADDYPMIWTEIHVTYLIWAENIRPKDVEQAIQLSEDKYCSVGIMLGKSAVLTSEYKILKPGDKVI
jgi:putative redox protein